jgi:hypothetical protein
MCDKLAACKRFNLPKFAAHPQNLIALFIASRFLKRRRRFSSHSLVRRYCMFTTIKAGAECSRFNVDRLEPHKISNNDFIAILNVFNQLTNEHIHNIIHTYM